MKQDKILQNVCLFFLLYVVGTGGILSGVYIYYFVAELVLDDPEKWSLILTHLAITLVSLFAFIRLYRKWDLGWIRSH